MDSFPETYNDLKFYETRAVMHLTTNPPFTKIYLIVANDACP